MSNYDFIIEQGVTFKPQLKYSQPQFEVKPITALTRSGQAVVTATAHGLTVDWPVWIVGVVGMTQVNHRPEDLRVASKAYYSYFVDANTVRLNLDTTRFTAYTSGGELMYKPPVDLTGFTARMQIRETVDATAVLKSLTTENGGITLGDTAGTVDLLISATETAAFTFGNAVYDLELIDGSGIVTRLLSGNVSLSKEVTRA
jgi:hypothetical protein